MCSLVWESLLDLQQVGLWNMKASLNGSLSVAPLCCPGSPVMGLGLYTFSIRPTTGGASGSSVDAWFVGATVSDNRWMAWPKIPG